MVFAHHRRSGPAKGAANIKNKSRSSVRTSSTVSSTSSYNLNRRNFRHRFSWRNAISWRAFGTRFRLALNMSTSWTELWETIRTCVGFTNMTQMFRGDVILSNAARTWLLLPVVRTAAMAATSSPPLFLLFLVSSFLWIRSSCFNKRTRCHRPSRRNQEAEARQSSNNRSDGLTLLRNSATKILTTCSQRIASGCTWVFRRFWSQSAQRFAPLLAPNPCPPS